MSRLAPLLRESRAFHGFGRQFHDGWFVVVFGLGAALRFVLRIRARSLRLLGGLPRPHPESIAVVNANATPET
jgi:hypothetical protein